MSGDVLASLLSPVELERAGVAAGAAGSSVAVAAVRLGLVAEDVLAGRQAEALGLRLVPNLDPPLEPLPALNLEFCRKRQCALLSDGDTPALIVVDAADTGTLDAVEFALGYRPPLAIATLSKLEALHARLAEAPADSEAQVGPAGSARDRAADLTLLNDQDSDAPAIRLANRILLHAVESDASDIHVEPGVRDVAIRMRIDGRLVGFDRVDGALALPLASRLKIMAGLDIAETRIPQDGRITVPVKGRTIDIRVATSPAAHGETVTLRLLGRGGVAPDLDRLGLPPAALAHFEAAIARPHGIILVTGPTGSGKTTTLYAALSRLNRPETKILTAEDPIEIELPGINQVQVRPDIDLTYARLLRSFLRQDPDVLMIGEIRDRETAEIALRAAMTGHLVLSTLHTNTALGAFSRLRDIGAEPFLVAATALMVAAQRLVRRLCPHCRSETLPDAETTSLFAAAGRQPPANTCVASGCNNCRGSGYRGRLPVVETVPVTEQLREMIRAGASERDMASLVAGRSMLNHGLDLVAAGETTAAELTRAIALGD